MSRIGKKPIEIPKGVKINITEGAVDVTGPKGTLNTALPEGITLRVDGDERLAPAAQQEQRGDGRL